MKINVKIYPIAGLNEATQVMDAALDEGNLSELVTFLCRQLGADLREYGVMILNNGQSLDIESNVILNDGDNIWVMPRLSGG